MKVTQYFYIVLLLLLSYSYGVLTVYYEIFPYRILKSMQDRFETEAPKKNIRSEHKNSFFDEFKQGEYKFDAVFIGDSITEFCNWNELFPDYKVVNRGVAGDTTYDLLSRMDTVLNVHAKKAFIMIGVNDFSSRYSVDEVFDNYQSIIRQLVEQNFDVYVQSTILAGKRFKKINKKIKLLNQKLQSLALTSKDFSYIDLNRAFSESVFLPAEFSYDGIHLNGKGYRVWQNTIHDFIE